MARPAKGMHREDIKAAIRKHYGSAALLADAWGTSKSLITRVLADPLASVVTEQRLAEAIGKKPWEVWPDRWSPDGKPHPFPVRKNVSAFTRTVNRQKREVA